MIFNVIVKELLKKILINHYRNLYTNLFATLPVFQKLTVSDIVNVCAVFK